MNYMPAHQALLSMINSHSGKSEAKTISVPESALKLMLQMALVTADFDEATYLRENSDVTDSIRRGLMPNGKFHYVNFGYFEGRTGAVPFDATWYEKQYPDVAIAIRSGNANVKTAMEHFSVAGAAEGRAPNAKSQPAVQAWMKALGRE